MKRKHDETPIARAAELVGGQSALARLLKVRPQSVSRWVRSGYVPAKRIVQIERITNGQVTRQELRPELYERLNSLWQGNIDTGAYREPTEAVP